jgi:uncharacterized protein with FMN-binding domain
MDRRTFVTGSTLGLAGAALAGSLGTAALANEAAEEIDAAPASGTPAWLGEEPQIDPAAITATYDCDILVVGAGCAGSAAAATAAELGLNCICIERADCVPETREYLAGVNTQFTLATGQEVDPGKLLNEISRYASGKCDRDLIKLWIDNSSEMIDWVDGILSEAGKEVTVDVPPEHPTGGTDYYVPCVQHCWEPSYEYPMRNDLFVQKAQQAGNDVLFNCKLVRLLHDGGAVSGGICDYDGSLIQINAARTIIASGGYGGNVDMMRALQPDTVRCITAHSNHTLDDGSGIKAGIWAGAAKQNDPTPIIFDRGAVLPGQDAGYELCDDGTYRFPGQNYQLNPGSQPFLKVNRRGERFANESTPYDNMLFATGRQPGGVFCQVFDGSCDADVVRFATIGCASYTRAMVEYAGFTLEEFIDFDGGTDTFCKADTLDELADKLGFEGDDKDRFLATCERYNELYDAQDDSDYGKEAYRLSELRTPPFYGCWYGASLLGTFDGLLVNAKLQALDADYNPVPGLYAIGDASSGLFNGNYPEYIPGLAAGRSVTEGRQCVKMIAEEADFAPTAKGAPVEKPAGIPAELADGTYTGSGEGMGGTINVTVEVKDGVISVVEIGPNYETPRYPGSYAIESGMLAEQIEAAQSDEIDGMSAASVTTGAVKYALRQALRQAAK